VKMTPHVQELLADISRQVAAREAETYRRIKERVQRNPGGDQRHITSDEWRRFYAETSELRGEYQRQLKALSDEAALSLSLTIIKEKGSTV
jgi:hypothetical protein